MTNVKDIMTKTVQFCTSQDPVTKAAQIMREVNCGSVPVCDGKRVVGMITDRDIVMDCVADGKDIKTVLCRDCMTSNVISCSPETEAHECANLMAEHQIRRIPVVQNGELAGICAIGDLATINIFVNEAGEALSHISEQLH